MTIVFLSNFFNHHQSAVSDALWTLSGGNYTFVESCEIPDARKQLGYSVLKKEYVISIQGNEEKVKQLVREADIVISGSAPGFLARERIKIGKPLFRYSERPLKNGLELYKYIPRLVLWHWRNPFRKPIYLLCASAYTAQDYRKFGLFRNKVYKWGYFPETKQYPDMEALIASKNPKEILWCGRFLDWKHPDDVLSVAQRLRDDGYDFNVKFIGTGIMDNQLKLLVQKYHLEERVDFLGSMRPEMVRVHMESAGIYLFTSDQREGWGAVLNESMNSGCAVVASHAIGAVPYLVENESNGLIYTSGDIQMLYDKVKYLLDNPQEQKRLGTAAYRTITEVWNAEVAAERLIALSKSILQEERTHSQFTSGPCSRAD